MKNSHQRLDRIFILLYKTDNEDVKVEILLLNENLWLTQAKMAELFDVQKAAISKHLKNIFESGELQKSSVVSKMETTVSDGKKYKRCIIYDKRTLFAKAKKNAIRDCLGMEPSLNIMVFLFIR